MRKTPLTNTALGSLLERDQTPESGAQSTIDHVLSAQKDPSETSLRDRIAQLSDITTPRTLPRVAHTEMNPKDAHQRTTSPPDTGFRLGFTDIPTKGRRSIASVQNSPTKTRPRQNFPPNLSSSSFEFKFANESNLSDEAQKLMGKVRDEAARIKAQMLAEKRDQDLKDNQAEQLFEGLNTTGRKMARPKGKAGRFSDIHMAEFKKMDSIANHASSFRAQPGFSQPTTQSLKRSGSRAGLDEPERPRTAGKGTPSRPAPPFMRQASTSPFKSISTAKIASERFENTNTAKRMRPSEFSDVSSGRRAQYDMPYSSSKTSDLLRAKPSMPDSVLPPTRSSLARSVSTKTPTLSPEKKSSLPRSNSVRSLKGVFEAIRAGSNPAPAPANLVAVSTVPTSRSDSIRSMRPLPRLPASATMLPEQHDNLTQTLSIANIPSTTSKTGGLASRLPTLAGLKSILRPSLAQTRKKTSPLSLDQGRGTPKRANTAIPRSESPKKVDFTPSTKSRYVVKLAATSPSPSKLPRAAAGPTAPTPLDFYDPSAYTIDDEDGYDDNDNDWEDAGTEVVYPTLPSFSSASTMPSATSVDAFSETAKQHNRRESKEFKSIFTTLEHPSRSKPAVNLTDVNTKLNQINPTARANIVTRSPSNNTLAKRSSSTIRRVHGSGVTELVQPFEDTIKTVPHGLPGKKRRRESDNASDLGGADDGAKENRRLGVMSQVPGGWTDDDRDTAAEKEDEGERRGGKRARIAKLELEEVKLEVKKPRANAAREAAAKNAKERKGKGKGILSLSRLNMLARPKERK